MIEGRTYKWDEDLYSEEVGEPEELEEPKEPEEIEELEESDVEMLPD